MKRLVILTAIAMAGLSVSALAAPVATKNRYELDKNMLGDPAALNWNIEACSHSGITLETREKLANLWASRRPMFGMSFAVVS